MELVLTIKDGATLQDLYENTEAAKTISEDGPWTDVVLQEQSQQASLHAAQVVSNVEEFAAVIHKARARPVIMEGWVHYGHSHEEETYRETFRKAAESAGGLLVPAGQAMSECLRSNPEIAVYLDDRHPTKEGTYLIACVFYSKLYGLSPIGLPHDLVLTDQLSGERLSLMNIKEDVARKLQSIALRVVKANR